MRASEFVLEATKPTDPPPKVGEPEFENSKKYFMKIIQTAIKEFNDELKFLKINNTTEYNNKTNNQEKLFNELTKSVVDAVISKGAGYFVTKDKPNFIAKFTLKSMEAQFNDDTAQIELKNEYPILALATQATSSWYANRHAKFTNPTLWARYQGAAGAASVKSSKLRVAPLEAEVARNIETIIGNTVTSESFWKSLLEKIIDAESRLSIILVIKQFYKNDTVVPEFPTSVTPIDARAGNQLANELKMPAVDDSDFWFYFADKLKNRPEIIIGILTDYYE